jgi:hypothetical protein
MKVRKNGLIDSIAYHAGLGYTVVADDERSTPTPHYVATKAKAEALASRLRGAGKTVHVHKGAVGWQRAVRGNPAGTPSKQAWRVVTFLMTDSRVLPGTVASTFGLTEGQSLAIYDLRPRAFGPGGKGAEWAAKQVDRILSKGGYKRVEKTRGVYRTLSNPTRRNGAIMAPAMFFDGDPRYLPAAVRGTFPNVDPQGTDLSIWSWDENGKHYAIVYAGKQTKPLWHHRFSTPAARTKHIQDSIDARHSRHKIYEDRATKRREHVPTTKVGDIFYTSGGYDQTNVAFYQVTRVSGKVADVRKVASRIDHSERGADYVVAVPDKFLGPAKRVRLNESGFKMNYHYAHPWDGRPKYETALGWGH